MQDYTEIIRDIKAKKYAPVYFLHGEETFFIDNITAHIENNVLDESQKSFNQYILYGKETKLSQIVSVAKKYPMMGERQVVVVKEAHEIAGWTSEEEQEVFAHYMQNPLPSTILLLAYKYKSFDKRKKVYKMIDKHAINFESKKIYDDQLPGWIQSYAKASATEITPKASYLMAENIGNNLQRLSNELEKLLINVAKGQAIDEKDVHRHVGISKEYNVFELQKMIGLGNFPKAIRIAQYLGSNPGKNPIILTIGNLYSYFSKLLMLHSKRCNDVNAVANALKLPQRFASEYLTALKNYHLIKVLQNIELIHKADLKSKGVDYNMSRDKESEILKELVFELMH
ncbi:MAG: DNA polymerase-3 subunit delta [Paraglaciecola sp.]|jgi:DNA polymerase-3 subunit delta